MITSRDIIIQKAYSMMCLETLTENIPEIEDFKKSAYKDDRLDKWLIMAKEEYTKEVTERIHKGL